MIDQARAAEEQMILFASSSSFGLVLSAAMRPTVCHMAPALMEFAATLMAYVVMAQITVVLETVLAPLAAQRQCVASTVKMARSSAE